MDSSTGGAAIKLPLRTTDAGKKARPLQPKRNRDRREGDAPSGRRGPRAQVPARDMREQSRARRTQECSDDADGDERETGSRQLQRVGRRMNCDDREKRYKEQEDEEAENAPPSCPLDRVPQPDHCLRKSIEATGARTGACILLRLLRDAVSAPASASARPRTRGLLPSQRVRDRGRHPSCEP